MQGECFDELFEMDIVRKMGRSGIRLVGLSMDFARILRPNRVLTPSQSPSKTHSRHPVPFSKIFVWGACILREKSTKVSTWIGG